MFCPNCGVNTGDSLFCPECGAEIKTGSEEKVNAPDEITVNKTAESVNAAPVNMPVRNSDQSSTPPSGGNEPSPKKSNSKALIICIVVLAVIIVILTAVLIVAVINKKSDSGSDTEDTEITEVTSEESDTEETAEEQESGPDEADTENTDTGYAAVYIEVLNSMYRGTYPDVGTYDASEVYFSLAYVDDDDIPELVVSTGDYHSAEVFLLTYSNGKAVYIGSYGTYGYLSYVERGGKIGCSSSNQGNTRDYFYGVNGTEVEELDQFMCDENSEEGYYEINGIEVGEEEYERRLSEYEDLGFTETGRDYQLTPANISAYIK